LGGIREGLPARIDDLQILSVYPGMGVSPTSISVVVPSDGITTADITIGNAGGQPLAYTAQARFIGYSPTREEGVTAAVSPASVERYGFDSKSITGKAAIVWKSAGVAKRCVDDELLVRFRKGAAPSMRKTALAQCGGSVIREYKIVPGLCLVKLNSAGLVEGAISTLRASGSVEYAEPNYMMYVDDANVPNDPSFSSLWGMSRIDAPEA
ncbi:MAG: hypothetical protein P8123_10300, partial [bacterium]